MKATRKLMALVLALVLVFSLGATAFAAAGDYLWTNGGRKLDDTDITAANSSTYVVGDTYATSATVTLIVEAGDCLDVSSYEVIPNSGFRKEIVNINVTDTNVNDGINGVTVSDLLDTVNGSYGLTFNNVTDPTEAHVYFLESITTNGHTWSAGNMGLDGWVFRVNDKYPVQRTSDNLGFEGTLLNQTPIHDGDVIHLFFDMPAELEPGGESLAANYIRGVLSTKTDSAMTIQLQGQKTWIDQSDYSNMLMCVYSYENAGAGITATLYDAAGTQVATATSAADGTVTFTGNFAAGTYVVQTDSSLRAFAADDDWYDYCNNTFFINTGAYSKIVVE